VRPRFLAEGPIAAGLAVLLPAEEARHARVRRLSDGDEVEVLDGRGTTGHGRLSAGGSAVAVEAVTRNAGEGGASWTVALAVAEPSRVEWAVEKGTECGAAGFLLWTARRSQPAAARSLEGRLPRLRKVAVEAVKQCGRSVVPAVEGPLSFDALLARRPSLVAMPGGRRLEPGMGLGPDGRGTIVVGPEGGLTPEEEEALAAAGAAAFSLGPRVLRLETAVVASLVAVSIG
jgi:16S rRNA (uracil1498-N3)-methyltransferase